MSAETLTNLTLAAAGLAVGLLLPGNRRWAVAAAAGAVLSASMALALLALGAMVHEWTVVILACLLVGVYFGSARTERGATRLLRDFGIGAALAGVVLTLAARHHPGYGLIAIVGGLGVVSWLAARRGEAERPPR